MLCYGKDRDVKMLEHISFYKEGQSLIASIACDIDHHSARGLREAIDKKIFENQPRILVLDFDGVSFMDSSGIGLILGRAELCRGIGARVNVTGLNPHLKKLVLLSGVDRIKNVSVLTSLNI